MTRTDPEPITNVNIKSSAGEICPAMVSAARAAPATARPPWTAISILRRSRVSGKHASDDAEQHVGEHVGGLDERDEDRGVGGVDKQPLGANGLHPGAEVADEGGEPEPPEDRDP